MILIIKMRLLFFFIEKFVSSFGEFFSKENSWKNQADVSYLCLLCSNLAIVSCLIQLYLLLFPFPFLEARVTRGRRQRCRRLTIANNEGIVNSFSAQSTSGIMVLSALQDLPIGYRVYPFISDRSNSSKICIYTNARVIARGSSARSWSRLKWKCRSTWETDLFSRWLNSFWRRSLTLPNHSPAERQTALFSLSFFFFLSHALLFSSWIKAPCTLDRCQILR